MKIKKENLVNIPNALTLSRLVLTFVIIYMIFSGFQRITIAIIFAIAAFTDALDGNVARIFNQKTKFGKKFDIFADRIFLFGVFISFLIYNLMSIQGNKYVLFQFFLILSREVIEIPVTAVCFLIGKVNMKATPIQKATTAMQFISLAFLIAGFGISIYFVIPTSVIGIIAGISYFKESLSCYK